MYFRGTFPVFIIIYNDYAILYLKVEISNPNPLDKKKSYFRPFATEDKAKNFSKYDYKWNTSRSTGQKARYIKKNFKK